MLFTGMIAGVVEITVVAAEFALGHVIGMTKSVSLVLLGTFVVMPVFSVAQIIKGYEKLGAKNRVFYYFNPCWIFSFCVFKLSYFSHR